MVQISIQPIPAQRVSTVLSNQNCQIALNQKAQGIFVDINVNGVDVSLGVLARDGVPLNACPYSSFTGNLFLIDTQGSEDPSYSGLGSRWLLLYLTADEYASY